MLETKFSSSSSSRDEDEVLDLSQQELSKLRRATAEAEINTTSLILDHNHLARLDNVHTYLCLEKLSAAFNSLVRMFQVGKLGHLKILDLSHNNITVMEGLKELRLLVWLNLSSNAITNIENIAHCIHLEHLDLSDNRIAALADLSFLKNLNTLLLHQNLLTCLRGCERFLPHSLTTLTLNENKISCLTEVQHLQQLNVLEHLVIAGNPAVEQSEDSSKQFDYRPYVINWCLNITSLDGIAIAAKESLKAEWMYCQSRGRQFGSGEHEQLIQYLVETCPLHPGDDWQEDEKLNLILSKVQEHQSTLHSNPVSVQQGETSKKSLPSLQNSALSPRSRHLSQHKHSTSTAPSSVHHLSISKSNGKKIQTPKKKISSVATCEATSSMSNISQPKPQMKANPVKQQVMNRPLSVSMTGPIAPQLLSNSSSSQSDSEFDVGSRQSTPQRVSVDQLRSLQNQTVHQQQTESSMAWSMTATTTKCYAPERYSSSAMTQSTHQSRSMKQMRPSSASISCPSASKNESTNAASRIQSAWKGSNDLRVCELKQEVRTLRTEEHVRHLSKELQRTNKALDQERKLRILQMNAIKVLWCKLQMTDAIQRGGNTKSRPSSTNGSKISRRYTEHSINKLMDSLEATAPPTSTVENTNRTNNEVDNKSISQLGVTCDRLQVQIKMLQATLDAVVNIVHEELGNHASIREQEQREPWRTEVAVQMQSEMYKENTEKKEEDSKSLQTLESISSFTEEKNESSLPTASLQSIDLTKESLDVADSDTAMDSTLMKTTDQNLITESPQKSTQDEEVQDSSLFKKCLEPKKESIPYSLEKSDIMKAITRPSTLPLLMTKPASLRVGEDVNSFALSLVEKLIETGLQESVGGNDASNRGDSLKD